MIHPKKIYALLLVFVGLFFVSCTKVDDEVVASVIDAPVLTFENVDAGTNLESGEQVNFLITLKNKGGFDSTGLYVYAKLNNAQVGFAKTTPVAADSTVQVTIPWGAVAGDHNFIFSVEKATGDSSKFAETIEFPITIAVKKQVQKKVEVVDVVEKEQIVDDIFGETEEVDDVFDNVEDKLTSGTVTDQNEEAVLKTVKIVAEQELKISKTVTPTKVTFEDTTVTSAILPLSKTVVDPVTQVETEVLDTTTFFVALEIEEEVVTEKAIVDGAEVVTKKETKKAAIPVAIDVKPAAAGSAKKFESVEIKNGLGGLKIDLTTGAVTILSANRAVDADFWVVMADELATANTALFNALVDPNATYATILNAIVAYTAEFASIVKAYELQKAVKNEPPHITIIPSTGSSEYRQGNDLVMLSWDVFEASATDDKPGVKFTTGNVFDPGAAGAVTMLPQSFTFTAIDSDGATSSVTVTSKYKKVVVEDVFIHDQGEGGN